MKIIIMSTLLTLSLPLLAADYELESLQDCLPIATKAFNAKIDLTAGVKAKRDLSPIDNNAVYLDDGSNDNAYIALTAKIPLYGSLEVFQNYKRDRDMRDKLYDLYRTYQEAQAKLAETEKHIPFYHRIYERALKRVDLGAAVTAEAIDALNALKDAELEAAVLHQTVSITRQNLDDYCRFVND